MDILHGIIIMTQSERHFRVTLEVTDVIQNLRGDAAATDINAMYGSQDTVENNPINETG